MSGVADPSTAAQDTGKTNVMGLNFFKKAVDLAGISPGTKRKLDSLNQQQRATTHGIAGEHLAEPVPNFIQLPSEEIVKNMNNASIVLGRDRPDNALSGYGGKGDTQAASIDLVAGYQGAGAVQSTPSGEDVYCNPNFFTDASRIYISQKTDVDKNFALAAGTVGLAIAKSAVALKADGIRLIAREGIKLITKTDAKNSQGGDIRSTVGIDLIAGNDDEDMQPLVKGDNLIEAIDAVIEQLSDLNGIVDSFLMAQQKFNAALTNHTHIGNRGWPTAPSFSAVGAGITDSISKVAMVKTSLIANKTNLATTKFNFLNLAGEKYINSRHNNTN